MSLQLALLPSIVVIRVNKKLAIDPGKSYGPTGITNIGGSSTADNRLGSSFSPSPDGIVWAKHISKLVLFYKSVCVFLAIGNPFVCSSLVGRMKCST